ncbi:MAG: site-2 protease family protein [Anaerolineae bacterium]|nr:site-2 protease family protein [Phycisphaerae bacterium]
MLAVVDFGNPLIWAVFIGWIMSVVLHEFGHGIVAYFGGDYTIRERGGLTLNPLQYVDPVFSLLIPAVIFLVGGVPLPGGVTYIRRDLIRTRAWQVAVSAAGPAMNFLLFLLCALPFHPKIGLIQPTLGMTDENLHLFLGAMAWLQMLSVLFNLVPVPPLDGYQMAEQFLPDETRDKIGQSGTVIFFIYFAILWQVPGAFQYFHNGVENTLKMLGFDEIAIGYLQHSFNQVLFGKT